MVLKSMDKNLLIYRIDSLLEHIDLVLEDTKGLTASQIKDSSLLVRATCFSISQIGEIMNHLEKDLSSRYKSIPWVGARRMRNVIVHDYGSADILQIYSTICDDLPTLKLSFIEIKKDLFSE